MLKNRSMPQSVIIPEIPYSDVLEAADWLCNNFGFTERLRIGNHRVQLQFSQGDIVITGPAPVPVPRHSVMVRLINIDDHYTQTFHNGVKIVNPPVDYPYGERQYTALDLAGHHWTFSQTLKDVDPEEWGGLVIKK